MPNAARDPGTAGSGTCTVMIKFPGDVDPGLHAVGYAVETHHSLYHGQRRHDGTDKVQHLLFTAATAAFGALLSHLF
jgi:hypothetical protein